MEAGGTAGRSAMLSSADRAANCDADSATVPNGARRGVADRHGAADIGVPVGAMTADEAVIPGAVLAGSASAPAC